MSFSGLLVAIPVSAATYHQGELRIQPLRNGGFRLLGWGWFTGSHAFDLGISGLT